jgi:hypothetical protein
MIEPRPKHTPAEFLREVRCEVHRESIVLLLSSRFGPKARELEVDLKAIEDDDRLLALIRLSASCRSLKAFHKHLSP